MRVSRVHSMNDEFTLHAMRLPASICPLASIAFAIIGFSAIAHAQIPTNDNPLRTASNGSASLLARTPSDNSPSDQRVISEQNFADVIHLERLPQHSERPVVTAMSVSPQGEYLAAAGDDHAIRIVSIETGKTIATLLGHLDWVQSLEFSPDGTQLASCSNDGTIRVWSVSNSPQLLFQKTVEHALLALTFLSNEQLYAAGFGNNIYRMNIPDKKLSIDHVCECNDIRCVACSPDGQWMAYGGRDGVLRIRSTAIQQPSSSQASSSQASSSGHADSESELVAPLHFDRIRSIQFSDDSQQLTSVGEDRRIVHYDMVRRKAIGQTEIGGGKLMGLCQLEPHLFAIAGSDNTIRIFSDTQKGVLVKLVGHDGSVSILKRTAKHLISGSFDTTIRIWDIDRAISGTDNQGRYIHPVAAQFEDSGAGDNVK